MVSSVPVMTYVLPASGNGWRFLLLMGSFDLQDFLEARDEREVVFVVEPIMHGFGDDGTHAIYIA